MKRRCAANFRIARHPAQALSDCTAGGTRASDTLPRAETEWVRGGDHSFTASNLVSAAQKPCPFRRNLLQRLKIVLHQIIADFLSEYCALHNRMMKMHTTIDSGHLHLFQQVFCAAEGAGCGLGASAQRWWNGISYSDM